MNPFTYPSAPWSGDTDRKGTPITPAIDHFFGTSFSFAASTACFAPRSSHHQPDGQHAFRQLPALPALQPQEQAGQAGAEQARQQA